MRFSNQLIKRVLILFIILLIPFIITGFISIYKNNTKLLEDTLSSVSNATASHAKKADDILSQTRTPGFHILEQSSMIKLSSHSSYLSPYERGIYINLLREQLSSLSLGNSFVSSSHAIFYTQNNVYHSNGYPLGSFSNIDQVQKKNYEYFFQHFGVLLYEDSPLSQQKELSLFLLTPGNKLNCGIQIVLSIDELERYLASCLAYENDYFVYSLDNGLHLGNLPTLIQNDLQNYLDCIDLAKLSPYQKISLSEEDFYLFYTPMPFSKGYFIRLISAMPILASVHSGYLLMIYFFLFIVGACLFFFLGIRHMVHRPLAHLVSAFGDLEQGKFDTRIILTNSSEFSYLFDAFNKMCSKIQNLIEHDFHQKLLLQKSELKQLQAQINPHFLYNSFFMLQRSIVVDPEQAQEISHSLGIYFQYITRNSMDFVPFLEEYRMTKSYCYIQSLRYTGRISVEFEELPEAFLNIPVPKLILQPIIENAFQYGLDNKAENGLLRISFCSNSKALFILVEDNGDELSDETLQKLQTQLYESETASLETEMTGILNIQRRLSVFSSSSISLTASRSSLGGLCVTISILSERMENI